LYVFAQYGSLWLGTANKNMNKKVNITLKNILMATSLRNVVCCAFKYFMIKLFCYFVISHISRGVADTGPCFFMARDS